MKRKDTILTKGERDVLVLVARGLTNEEIADRLQMSTNKVKTFLHQACVKLKAHNRIESVFFALRHGDINLREVFSLNELAELLASLGPEAVGTIAQLVSQKLEHGHLTTGDKQLFHKGREKDNILTKREQDVLILVAHGLTNEEIADKLCTSTSTVRTFLYQACAKLEARNRAQAFISALKQRAINVGEVFSLDELVELLASLGPESVETISRLLRQKLEQERLPSGI
ncbi:MAG: LuxR C-terminal-related transcriptional regulator [Chloroflexi bacterium]|nr:LuxR C-terminal-related transcriptional regulator [Chloroflexota bacterium]